MDERTKRLFMRIAPLMLLVSVAAWAESKLVTITSESIGLKLAFRSEKPAQKGDYVNFTFSHPFIGNTPRILTKRFSCGPGDELRSDENRHFFCNGEYLGIAKKRRMDGRPFDHFQWNGPIPPGKAFVTGDHPDSFDSRYWGFIDVDRLERVVPLI